MRKLNPLWSNLDTEKPHESYEDLDTRSALDIVCLMNADGKTVAAAIEPCLPRIAEAVEAIVQRLRRRGRLFYIGAGTSGRLGALDAAECVPTFNTPPDLVQSVVAGGAQALQAAIEEAEDDEALAVADLKARDLSSADIVVGISASGRTPYVVSALAYAKELGAATVALSCNRPSRIGEMADIPIEVPTGPEIVMGSTRLKAGTAQKMVLNMLSTAAMIRLGKVYRNLMVDLRATNQKLVERSKHILMLATGASYDTASRTLAQAGGSVKGAIVMLELGVSGEQAEQLLRGAQGRLRAVLADAGREKAVPKLDGLPLDELPPDGE